MTASADANSSHTITGLINGTTYYFMVQATNPIGSRNANAEVSAMPFVSTSAPTPTLDITDDTRWELTWPAVTGTAPITYTVSRTSALGAGFGATTEYTDLPGCVNSAANSCSDTTVVANKTYCYKVTATNPGGSKTSPQICPPLTTPPTLTLSTNRDIQIPTWGGAPPLQYSIESGPGAINPSTGVYNTTRASPATIKVTDAQSNSQTITVNNKRFRFDGMVNATTQAGTSLYVGGYFLRGNPIDAPNFMVLDLNGKPKYGCDLQSGFNGYVLAVTTAKGSVYVGGLFTQYRGQLVNRVAKLKFPSCELDTTFSPPAANGFNASVNTLAVVGSSLYVGGAFTDYKGVAGSANRIAKLNLITGALDNTFSPPADNGFNGIVNALAVAGSSLFVGGLFTAYKGIAGSANRIAKLNLTNGDFDTKFSPPEANGFNHNVRALAIAESSLYVGGNFTDYKGVAGSANRIAKLNLTNGDLDTAFSPPASNGFSGTSYVRALAISGSSLYVGGYFTAYKGVARSANRIAKLDLTNGDLDTNFSRPETNGFNNDVAALAIAGSNLYVGGEFQTYYGVAHLVNRIAKIDLTTGAVDTTFSPPTATGFNGEVRVLAVAGSSLYVGGNFTAYRGVAGSANYIAKLDLNTGALDTTFSPPAANGFNGTVYALTSAGSSLYVGGAFTAYKGVANSARRIAKLNLTSGALDTTFSPSAANGFNGTVYALTSAGSSLYLGGAFTSYKGVAGSANRIAKLNLITGALDTTFSPPASNGFDGTVDALAVAGTSLYVGGGFNSYRGVANAANKIAKLDLATGELDTIFSPPGANGFGRFGVWALAVSGSSLYVGGEFNDYRGVPDSANNIAKLDLATGELDTTFSPPGANGFDYDVSDFVVSGSTLYVGGWFSTYRGNLEAPYLVPLDLNTGALAYP